MKKLYLILVVMISAVIANELFNTKKDHNDTLNQENIEYEEHITLATEDSHLINADNNEYAPLPNKSTNLNNKTQDKIRKDDPDQELTIQDEFEDMSNDEDILNEDSSFTNQPNNEVNNINPNPVNLWKSLPPTDQEVIEEKLIGRFSGTAYYEKVDEDDHLSFDLENLIENMPLHIELEIQSEAQKSVLFLRLTDKYDDLIHKGQSETKYTGGFIRSLIGEDSSEQIVIKVHRADYNDFALVVTPSEDLETELAAEIYYRDSDHAYFLLSKFPLKREKS